MVEAMNSVNAVATCNANIGNDFVAGVLDKKNGLTIFGVKITDDKYVFHSDKYKEKNEKEIPFGEIAKRYCLEPGVLKNTNNLRIGAGQVKDGLNLNNVRPSTLGMKDVKFPVQE